MAAFSGMGTTVTIGATTVKATSISSPSLKRGSIDVTNLESPDNIKEFVPGMLEAGDFSCDFFFPEGIALNDSMDEPLEAGYKKLITITFPNGGSVTFNGFLTEFTVDAVSVGDNAVKGKMTAKVIDRPVFVGAGA
jgi:Lambda phage tail tube protein, TTP